MSGMKLLEKMTAELKNTSADVMKLLSALTDEKSFVECDRFLRSQDDNKQADGEGVVSGFASIGGIDACVFAINPNVQKGSIGIKNSQKIVKCVENAVKTSTPVIGIFDTSGARLNEGIEAMEGYGKIISAFSSAYGTIPVITVVKGNNFGLSSYLSGLCDVCIGYDKSLLSSTSPLILSAKANTDIKNVANSVIHSEKTGIYSFVVKNDKELRAVVFNVLEALCVDVKECKDDPNRVATTLKSNSSVQAVLDTSFDKNSFLAIKKDFAKGAIVGFARLNGVSVGVVALDGSVNEGRLDTDMCVKISEFLYTCQSFNLPIVTIIDSKGVVVDLKEENGALIRETANLMYTYNLCRTGKVALVTNKAIGSAYVAFASKGVSDFTLAWAEAEIGVIDSASLAELLYTDEIVKSKDKASIAKTLANNYKEENSIAIAVAEKGYIDNVIEPQFTRQYLISAVLQFMNKE